MDIGTPFKRDVRVKEAVNLDKDILPHKKSWEQKHNQLDKNLLES